MRASSLTLACSPTQDYEDGIHNEDFMKHPQKRSLTRELVVAETPDIVVYRVRKRVEILRIRHGAQR